MPEIDNTTWLYHATYNARLESIQKHGLVPNCEKAWAISEPDVIYLATDKHIACGFADAAEDVAQEIYDSGIVILAVQTKHLDQTKLKPDNNMHDNNTTCVYHGSIPPEFLHIVKEF